MSVHTSHTRCLTVGPFQSNCYVLGPTDRGRGVLVDPGDEADRILGVLGGSEAQLAAILLTHAHLDHVGAVAAVRRATGAPIYLHPADLPLYERAAEQGAQFGLAIEPPPAPDHELREDMPLVFDDLKLDVLHTPGHSPGGVTLVGDGETFVGDCVFAGSIGRTDLPGGDYDTLIDAIATKILSLPGETTLLPGHGPPTSVAIEASTNPFLAPLMEPCFQCGAPLPLRRFGHKGGHCPNCGHPCPPGDCSDA